ncbi:DegT/DnrJ/EryC1/StrS aminotransferase family protein [bacterium]|nr:DegT/DnrJ/EryC1/StrS aminotransferase family protein [bacterium]
MKVEFYKHNLGKQEIKDVVKVLNTVFLTTGSDVKKFETNFSRYIDLKHTVGLTSCTAALHLALLAHNIGPGDEVVTSPLTFIATATAIMHTGAKPVFVDVEEETGNLNAALIEKALTKKTKAILPVHLYGHMCDMQAISKIARKHKLIVIEDAAHALETKRDELRPGQASHGACFSFYATKNITSGEGGAFATNNKKTAERVTKLRSHGMSTNAADRYTKKYQHWDMDILGWKYNMDNIHAALLHNQLKNVEKNLKQREKICQCYEKAFSPLKDIRLLQVRKNTKSARHMFTILVPPKRRDEILWGLQKKGVGVAVNYRAIHLLKYFKNTLGHKRNSFPIAENIGESTITLPLYPKLTQKEVDYVIKSVISTLDPENGAGAF